MPSLLKAGQFRQQAGYGDEPYYRILHRTKPVETETETDTTVTEEQNCLLKALEAERLAIEERALRERLREESRKAGYEEGRRAGYEDGFAAGHREASARILAGEQEVLERLAGHCDDLTDACNDWLAAFQERSVELALAIAEKVLQTELQETPRRMEDLAARLLHEYRDKNPRVLIVSPQIRERLLQSERFRQALMELPAPVEIQTSDAFEDGDCLLDTPECRVDASVSTQLNRIRRGLSEITDEA